MRYVLRTHKPPKGFNDKAEKELNKAKVYYSATPAPQKTYDFKVYKSDEIKRELERLFHGKCAYCEIQYSDGQPMDAEHYRPKGGVTNCPGHPGYWWEAANWSNLLPSCIHCNRSSSQQVPVGDVSQVQLIDSSKRFSAGTLKVSGKHNSFPIARSGVRAQKKGDSLPNEKALLLNPCEDDPQTHIKFYFNPEFMVSFVLPAKLDRETYEDFCGDYDLSLKGSTSIHVYGLNRLGLVQSRTRILRQLIALGGAVADLLTISEKMKTESKIAMTCSHSDLLLQGGRRTRELAINILGEMKKMARSTEPHSTLVKSWLRDFQKSL